MRITLKDLDRLTAQINTLTGHELEPHNGEGWNIGTYYVHSAYNGNKLVQVGSDGGGIIEITHGYTTKKDLYNQMQAFVSGLRAK